MTESIVIHFVFVRPSLMNYIDITTDVRVSRVKGSLILGLLWFAASMLCNDCLDPITVYLQ